MAIYILYLIIAGVQSLYAEHKGILDTQTGKKWYLSVCCAEIVLLATLRGYHVGADTRTYLNALEYYSSLPRNEILFAELRYPFVFEKGYFFLTKLCAFLGISNSVFLLIIALLIYIPVFISIYHYSRIPYISILAYFAMGFFSYSLGIFRQMIAISIVLCGIKYIPQKNIIKYALCVAVASLFHTTAVAAILIYVAYHIPVKWYEKWIFPVEILCLVFGRQILMLLVEIFPKYAKYIGSQYDVQTGTYLMLVFLNILLCVSIYLYHKKYLDNRLTIAALSIAVMVQAVGYSMAILGRAVGYFSYFSVFALSDIAFVMMNLPDASKLQNNDSSFLCVCFKALPDRVRTNIRAVVWLVFIVGLGVLVLKDLVGNEFILPYYFSFME